MSLLDTIKANRQTKTKNPDPAPEKVRGKFSQTIDPDPPKTRRTSPDGKTCHKYGGQARRFMDSKVLGAAVPLQWTSDGSTVWVDGVRYTQNEVKKLVTRHPDAETLRGIHNVKKTFDGTLTI